MKKTYIATLLLLLCCTLCSAQKRFFNLTADEVKIDSVMPLFTHSVQLDAHYADSTYTAEILYPEFIDMTAADIARYEELGGEPLAALPQVTVATMVNRKQGVLHISFVPLVERNGKLQKLVSFMLDVKSTAKKKSVRRLNAATRSGAGSRYADHSVLATGKWAKIRVPESGIYQITDALVRQAGFSDVSKVKVYGRGGALLNEELTAEDLAANDDLEEVPLCIVDGKRLFHAQGPVYWRSSSAQRVRNPYSDYGYYFITQSDEGPQTIDREAFAEQCMKADDRSNVIFEKDQFAWYRGGRRLYAQETIGAKESKSYKLNTAGHTATGTLTVAASANTNTSVMVAINGVEKDTLTVRLNYRTSANSNFDKANDRTRSFAVDNLQGENTITLTNTGSGQVRLDYISIRTDTPAPLPDLATATFPAPEYVYNITNQDLHADKDIQMVIIIPASQKLRPQAERLKAFHEQHDSLKVRIVPADELFNEFSSGTPDASAYRNYLKMLYDRADNESQLPQYLLLFGDCAYDNRMVTSHFSNFSPDDFLLAFESEDSFSETLTYTDDGYFCNLDDGEGVSPIYYDMPDVSVGRFPVRTEAEAKVMVDKTIGYIENRNAGPWQNIIMFMGDDGNSNVHMSNSYDVSTEAEANAPGMHIKRVYWDAYERMSSSTGFTYPDVEAAVKQQQQDGALVMNYMGHGTLRQLSHETVLTLYDFQNFTNTNLPLWVTAACDVMPYNGYEENIGETAVLNPKGGAVAFFGTVHTVVTTKNYSINRCFMRQLLKKRNGRYQTIGEVQRYAKIETMTSSNQDDRDRTINKLQYQLLGDPALRLKVPEPTVVFDEINGQKVGTQGVQTLKAGTVVTVKGHVEQGGTTMTSFNGQATLPVRDAREHITCRLNNTSANDGASWAWDYYDHPRTLYSGTDSVSAGTFQFSFAVPLDINYSDERGLMNVYAMDNEKTLLANGRYDNYRVGGSDSVANDSIGPSIYCYLNSPDFVNGGEVNSTPFFVAQMTDKDGLNTTGNGVGHDLELVIDGQMNRTYVLNNNFSFDFGTYTSGKATYQIPELEEGMHTLRFRAWDVLNNSSTAELTFNVVHGLTPSIGSIAVSENPARTSTTFIVNHDRSGSNVEMDIEVFDMSGRLLWRHSDSGLQSTSTYTYDWNLTTDTGSQLQTGVYLYRVRLGSDGATKTSKAKKLVVIKKK